MSVIEQVLSEAKGPVCVTSSFQAECMVLTHMLLQHRPDVPVLFLDTGYHFAETYAYRDEMTARYGLNLINLLPRTTVAEQESRARVALSNCAERVLRGSQSGAALPRTIRLRRVVHRVAP